LAVCTAFQAWIPNPMAQIIPDVKSKAYDITDWHSAVYFKLGFQLPWLRSSSILNPRPGNHRLAFCTAFQACIPNTMAEIIFDFKSKTWESTDWQSALHFKLGFQIPWLRSSPILHPRPITSRIGILQCISSLDSKSHASDHLRF